MVIIFFLNSLNVFHHFIFNYFVFFLKKLEKDFLHSWSCCPLFLNVFLVCCKFVWFLSTFIIILGYICLEQTHNVFLTQFTVFLRAGRYNELSNYLIIRFILFRNLLLHQFLSIKFRQILYRLVNLWVW